MTGINLDLEESGAYVLINKDAKDIIKANQMIRTKSDEQLIEEIKKQAEIDKQVRINDVNLKKNMVHNDIEE